MKNLGFLLSILFVGLFTESKAQVQYPFGAAQGYTIANTGTTTVAVVNAATYPTAVTTLTANATVSVTVGSGVKAGARFMIAVKTTSTETTTFAGSIIAPVVTGASGKTWSQEFWYDGTIFRPSGAKIQVD